MRIFYSSKGGDPMLLDRVASMHAFARDLRAFADGERTERAFSAQTNGSPEPYEEFLPGARLQRVEVAYPECHLAADRWLEVRASGDALRKLCRNVEQLQNCDHTHLYSDPVSLIFEADDEWPGFDEN